MAHGKKPDFILLRLKYDGHAKKSVFVLLPLKCDGTRAETRYRPTAFEM
jgi:hypothetical protein